MVSFLLAVRAQIPIFNCHTLGLVTLSTETSHAWAVVDFSYFFFLSACFRLDVSVLHGLLRLVSDSNLVENNYCEIVLRPRIFLHFFFCKI